MCINTKELLGINDNSIKIIKIENIKENCNTNKYIHLKRMCKKVKCPDCKEITSYHYDTRYIKIKHLKSANYNTIIVIHKRRFKCKNCDKTFTEQFDFVKPRKRVSNSLNRKLHLDLRDNVSFKYVGKINNVSTTYVRNKFKKEINYFSYEKYFPKIISFDEFKADTDRGKYSCIINDPINKKTIDILPTRKKEDIKKYLKRVKNREEVEYVISDMWKPYLDITKIYFKNAKYVVDRFHYVRYIMDALDSIRVNLQKYYNNEHHKYIYKLLKNKKNVSLLRKHSTDIKKWDKVITCTNIHGNKWSCTLDQKLEEILDIDLMLRKGYQLKESFLDIIDTATYEEAEELLKQWIDVCFDSGLEPFMDAAETIRNWLPYIVNSFIDKRFTNGYTEGINNKIKSHKRVAFGYQRFITFRNRMLYILDKNIKS